MNRRSGSSTNSLRHLPRNPSGRPRPNPVKKTFAAFQPAVHWIEGTAIESVFQGVAEIHRRSIRRPRNSVADSESVVPLLCLQTGGEREEIASPLRHAACSSIVPYIVLTSSQTKACRQDRHGHHLQRTYGHSSNRYRSSTILCVRISQTTILLPSTSTISRLLHDSSVQQTSLARRSSRSPRFRLSIDTDESKPRG